ncbi:hypothetical protein [Streptomyces sp. NPDC002573]|uniref:hypothetical protein n=1 Tax=Streptomyces sp. NPDC002573 TaxID=3364651 RepID=UPI0036BA5A39
MSTNRAALLEMGRRSDLGGLGCKDLLLSLQAAHSREVRLPVTAPATQFLAEYHQI